MISKIVRFFGDAEFARIRRRGLITVLLLIVVADFFASRDHGDFFWDSLPAWWAIFGFLSCAIIIFVSKAIGHQGRIMRDKDYYD